MELQQLKQIIEAALMAHGNALSVERMQLLFEEHEKPDSKLIREALESLQQDMEGRGIEVKEVASGFRLQVRKEIAPWVSRLWEEKAPRYTRALLETLSLIAYRQPITRGDIEDVRGVAVSSNIIRTLLERDWVRVVGHRDVPGRPAMYATTKTFLDYFNLKTLDELPTLDEIREMDDANQNLELMNAEKRASATREYDFASEEDVENRGEEVLAATEQDIIEAEKLIDQVEDNVFNKPEEDEEEAQADIEEASAEIANGQGSAQPSLAEMAAKLEGETPAAEQSSVAQLAQKTEQRLASDLIADHQAKLRGEIDSIEPVETQSVDAEVTDGSHSGESNGEAVNAEEDERASLLAEQERLMQQLMQQESERQAAEALSEESPSTNVEAFVEEKEIAHVSEPSEDDELAQMEAEAAAELAMLEEEQAERELLEAERLEKEQLDDQNKEAGKRPDSLFSD